MSHRRFDVWSRAIAGMISLVSPARAARYLHGRVVYQLLAKRGYAAASSRGPNQLWSPVDRTAEDDIRIAAPKIRARARDLARNNPNLAGAIATIVYNVVGSGIVPQADVRRPDGSPDAAMNDQIEDAWRNWSDAGCDLTGELTFPEIEELTARHLIVDGEIFHHYVARDYLPGAIPLRLESIEADRIDALNVAGNMVNGIEYNGFMVKTAYHVFESNYGVGTYQSHPIPADEMLHIYHKQRASQFRGISWLAPIIMRLYDLSEYEDYEMIGAKLAAAFGVFIETPFSDMPVRYMGDQTAADSESPLEYIEPGRIQRLMPGEKVSVASHNRPGSNFDSFTGCSDVRPIAPKLVPRTYPFCIQKERLSGLFLRCALDCYVQVCISALALCALNVMLPQVGSDAVNVACHNSQCPVSGHLCDAKIGLKSALHAQHPALGLHMSPANQPAWHWPTMGWAG